MTARGDDGVDGDLVVALAERALARATLGAAVTGVVLGLLAAGFLVMSGNRLDATTLPVVVLAMIGQLGGLAGAAACAVRLRRLRAGGRPRDLARGAQHSLRLLARAVLAVGAGTAVLLVVLLDPLGSAVLASVLGAGLLAQVVVVLTVLRRPLGRASRAPHGDQGPPPAMR